MCIQDEITRLLGAKAAIRSAIEGKGVTVPQGTKLDGMAALIGTIPTGGVQPTLHAPTIALSDSTLTITNPAANGDFVDGFKVYSDGSLLTTTSAATVDLSQHLTAAGTYTVTVAAYGEGFTDSVVSDGVTAACLAAPVNLSASGTVVTFDPVEHAESYKVYADNVLIGEVEA